MGADSKPSDSHIVKMMEALKDSLQGIKTEAGKLEAMVRDLQSMLREKQIVSEHTGTIQLEYAKDKGTTFRKGFPAR